MHSFVSRLCLAVYILTGSLSLAQAPAPRTPVEPKDAPKELGPATQKTAEESADSVKAPVGVTPMPTAAPVDPATFEIGPEDILRISVWREPELSSAVQVRPDGKITLPLIGEVQAAGQTPESLKAKIVEALSEFINKPEVMVVLHSVQSRRYYISGEVNRPGTYPLVVPVTVLEALTNAGGFREFANTKKIRILRKGKVIYFNYKDVSRGKNLNQNIAVENGDHIFVD
jgi:polysaccharide export outer membrane protein